MQNNEASNHIPSSTLLKSLLEKHKKVHIRNKRFQKPIQIPFTDQMISQTHQNSAQNIGKKICRRDIFLPNYIIININKKADGNFG